MAKHNDMPELNSAKVFLTILFTKEYLRTRCQPSLTTGYNLSSRHLSFPNIMQSTLPAQHLTTPKHSCSATMLSGNSDINNFTVDGFKRISYWLKNVPVELDASKLRLAA